MDDERFNGSSLFSALVVTALVGLALVLVPTLVAVSVLVVVAFACGRLGGRGGGLRAVAAGALMLGSAITEPHFGRDIESRRDVVLLIVLFVASLVASEIGARIRHRRRVRQLHN